jgi:hypothetical protein
MPFVLETGAGVPGANSYAAVAAFQTYHEDRGNSLVKPGTDPPEDYSDEEIEQALIKATDYLDAKFEFVGYRTLSTQSLEWPRSSAYYNHDGRIISGLPSELVVVCYELAYRALSTSLMPDPTYETSGLRLTHKRTKVAVLETEWTAANGGQPVQFKDFPFERRLEPIIVSRGFMLRA